MKTIQESCDYAVSKIVEQGGRCVDELGCVYRRGEKHCAIGWLLDSWGLPDKIFNAEAALIDLLHEEEYRVLLYKETFVYLNKHFDVLNALQAFHDTKDDDERRSQYDALVKHGIDTSGPDWQTMLAWGDL